MPACYWRKTLAIGVARRNATMNITFQNLPDIETIAIKVRGHVAAEEVREMRKQTLQMHRDTGFRNYFVDLGDLESIAHGDDYTAYELGVEFRKTEFSLHTRTAIVLPRNARARQQAEFLHVVEINRGRGELRYVTSLEDATEWFTSCRRPVFDRD
jgi:hypothetical protein